MKNAKMLAILVLALGLMDWLSGVSGAVPPMGTAFTYQGRLIDANGPAEGLYDFEFKLWMDPCEIVYPPKVGDTLTMNDLDVIDGYFTVELDFNSPFAFNGYARWLEVAVRPGDSNDLHTILSPRQQVTPTPYAIRSHIADSSADGVTGSGTMNRLAKFTATKVVSDSAIYESGGKVGIGTTSPESRLQIEQSAGAWDEGIRLSYGEHVWDIITDYGGERLTIAPDQNSTRGLVMRNGKAGLGTSSPESRLHIEQESTAWNAGMRLSYGGHDWDIVSSGERLLIVPGQSSVDGLTLGNGKLGIGTGSPGSKLHVQQDVGAWGEGIRLSHGGHDWDIVSDNSGERLTIAPDQNSTEGIVITNGKVGIGTGSPEEELHVEGDARISKDLWVQDDLTVTGQYMGSFPRPAYDSGWFTIPPGQEKTLTHNLGGDPDNYVVDMTFRHDQYIDNWRIGGYTCSDSNGGSQGVYWGGLNQSTITVSREKDDVGTVDIRIRIWVYR